MKYILLVTLLLNTSCSKEFSCEKCTGTDFKNATIVYTGEPAWDGCGWLVKLDSKLYHPEVLSAAYLQDQLPVKIIFEIIPGKYVCGLSALEYSTIRVINIKK